jgi:hypothetical protein
MKKLLGFLLCLICLQTRAQKLYIRAVVGYAMPSLNASLVVNGYPYTAQQPGNFLAPAAMNVSENHASHGAGVLADVHAGYWFRKNIGVDVGLSYMLKPKHYTVQGGFGLGGAWLDITQYASHPLFASLSLALRDDRLLRHFYINAGALLPLSNKIITESRPSNSSDTIQTYSRTLTKTGFDVGLHATVGYDYPLTKRIAITACLSLNALSAWTKSSRIQAYTIDGSDYLYQIPEEKRQIQYQKNYGVGSNTSSNVLPAYQVSFSSLSFMIGVSVGL